MATYSILEAARIVQRTKSTVRHHIKKMPPDMVIREGKEVRLTEDGLSMLLESVNQVTDTREPGHEPPANHREPPLNQVTEARELDHDDREPGHEPDQTASVNQVTDDREPPVNHPDGDRNDRLRDMAQIINNLTLERDSLRTENDALKARIAHLEETINDLKGDRDRWVSMAQNAQRLHDQEQRIHVQDIALLSRKRLPAGGGNGSIIDRIKNVFTGRKSDDDQSGNKGGTENA